MKLKLIFALFEKKGKSCRSCRAEVFYKKHSGKLWKFWNSQKTLMMETFSEKRFFIAGGFLVNFVLNFPE